jgi:RND superfamily putative drug exporter
MRLAGEFNWWAPAPLRRLYHRIGLSETEGEKVPAVAAAGAGVRFEEVA